MKKILIGVMSLLMVSTVVKANLSSEIQTLSNLFQQGDYESAETVGRGILNDSSLTPEERATVNSIMSQIAIKQAQKQSNKTESTMKKSFTDQKVTETRDTGTMPASPDEDVSSEAKYNTYGNFENATLAKKSSTATFKMSQLYFKDGLYEKAVNLAKKDTGGDIRNLYVVAIGSRLMGNYDQAIDYYNRILAMSPDQQEAKLGIGIAYKSKGEFSKALEFLREYAEQNSNQEVVKDIAILNDILANKK